MRQSDFPKVSEDKLHQSHQKCNNKISVLQKIKTIAYWKEYKLKEMTKS